MDYSAASMELHKKHKGKLEVVSKVPIQTKDDLSIAYTPGVAEPCRQIAANPEAAYELTIKGRMVAVVTDGSAVLGLGNIGPGSCYTGYGREELSYLRRWPEWMHSRSVYARKTSMKSWKLS